MNINEIDQLLHEKSFKLMSEFKSLENDVRKLSEKMLSFEKSLLIYRQELISLIDKDEPND